MLARPLLEQLGFESVQAYPTVSGSALLALYKLPQGRQCDAGTEARRSIRTPTALTSLNLRGLTTFTRTQLARNSPIRMSAIGLLGMTLCEVTIDTGPLMTVGETLTLADQVLTRAISEVDAAGARPGGV